MPLYQHPWTTSEQFTDSCPANVSLIDYVCSKISTAFHKAVFEHQVVSSNGLKHIELRRHMGTVEFSQSPTLYLHVGQAEGERQVRIWGWVSDVERTMIGFVLRPLTGVPQGFPGPPHEDEKKHGRRFARAAQIRTENGNRPKNPKTSRKRSRSPDGRRYAAPRTASPEAAAAASILRTRQQAKLRDLAQRSENRLMSSGSYHSTEEIASGKYNVDLDSD